MRSNKTGAPAMVYGTPLGAGGLGLQAATALKGLSLSGGSLTAIGPTSPDWPRAEVPHVRWVEANPIETNARFFKGRAQYRRDCDLGRKAAEKLQTLSPSQCYGFTQVSKESATWCKENNVEFILDNPNGHIRNFQAVYRRESWRWCSVPYLGHPTEATVHRVEGEYSLATRIRVSSEYSKLTMVRAGVDSKKIVVIPQFIDLDRFSPPKQVGAASVGPLRICFAGALDLRKGFVYLLRALRRFRHNVKLRIVGSTGDPWCRRLFEREASGLDVGVSPGDPLSAYHWAELFVAPSLEDGFGFVVAEAMACGLPVLVSDQCGAAEWVAHGESGWVVPFPGSGAADKRRDDEKPEEKLVSYLELALENRRSLREMGRWARSSALRSFHFRNAALLGQVLQNNFA